MCQDTVELLHPLLVREIRPPCNWNEWRECWKVSTTTHQLLGLLHGGFEVGFDRYEHGEHEYNHIDRLETYFAIADGWADAYNQLRVQADEGKSYFVGYDQHGNSKAASMRELRQQLARKAFDMLGHNFFKLQVEDSLRPRRPRDGLWGADIVSGRLFEIILNFFRVDEKGGIRNLSHREESAHRMQHVISFLLELIKAIFKWEEEKIESWTLKPDEVTKRNAETRERIDVAKLWAIEVLAELHKLDLLWEIFGVQSWAFVEFDEPCLAKLKEIALRTKLDQYPLANSDARLATTLKEACYANSKTAWFLKKYDLVKAEFQRFSALNEENWARRRVAREEEERLAAIQKAEQQMQEAARNLRQLTATTTG